VLLGADDERFQAAIVVSPARRLADAQIKLGIPRRGMVVGVIGASR
jgi:hypothetical protein